MRLLLLWREHLKSPKGSEGRKHFRFNYAIRCASSVDNPTVAHVHANMGLVSVGILVKYQITGSSAPY